jgi:hypothetical protein
MALILLLAVASCGSMTQGSATEGGSPLIDVPSAPFPYNSRICP